MLFLSMQEENKILDKANRQKILEVEKLSQTIRELEEAILAGGAAANTLRDYKRQVSELQVRNMKIHKCYSTYEYVVDHKA